jgi:hypothetical protein
VSKLEKLKKALTDPSKTVVCSDRRNFFAEVTIKDKGGYVLGVVDRDVALLLSIPGLMVNGESAEKSGRLEVGNVLALPEEYFSVTCCARCQKDHAALWFRAFTVPPDGYTHFANCPTNGEPILMAIIPD